MGGPENARGHPIGGVILAVEGVSLAFGGVKALSDVSFDVLEHEVRAIIGFQGLDSCSRKSASGVSPKCSSPMEMTSSRSSYNATATEPPPIA